MEMDLIKGDDETIPEVLLDKLFEVVNRTYIEMGEVGNQEGITLSDSLRSLVINILREKDGMSCLIWTGIIIGQCITPTIELHNDSNKLPEGILNIACGYYFMYLGVNNPDISNKVILPTLDKSLRESIFVGNNNLSNMESNPDSYKDAMMFYYYLMALLDGEDFIGSMGTLLVICIGKEALCDNDDSHNKRLLLQWILLEVIPAAWDRRFPSNLFNRRLGWYQSGVVPNI